MLPNPYSWKTDYAHRSLQDFLLFFLKNQMLALKVDWMKDGLDHGFESTLTSYHVPIVITDQKWKHFPLQAISSRKHRIQKSSD